MPNQTYQATTVPPDLRREETIKQICDSLEYLEKISNDIFSRISKKVTDNHSRLRNINDRVNLAQARIDKIKGSNKATKVFSSAKYPADKTQELYHSIYSEASDLGKKHSSYKLQSKHQAVDDRVLKEKLQYYNVHLNVKSRKKGDEGEGLGRLPKHIPSISSLLLFNTSENPYKKYVMLDPLGVVTKTRTTEDEIDEGLADAPTTITEREEMQRVTRENMFYVPTPGQVPEIAVPDFLPDLVGVADDLSYSADFGPSIAPSVPGSNMPDLPSVVPDLEAVPSGPAAPGSGPPPGPPPPGPPPPPSAPPGPPPPPPSAPPPPPPPPPPSAAPPVDAPPPPPPPPSGGADASTAPSVKANGAPPEVTSPDSGRASLLDAIRQAGGAGKAKLKNAKERKVANKKIKKEEKSSGGGDLMGDLFNKLSMRRKGISGTGKQNPDNSDSTGGGGAMHRISTMIPPPPKLLGADEGDAGDDWD